MTVTNGRGRRTKGAKGEAELCKLIADAGWPHCRRNFGSGACGGADLIEGPADTAWECKRQERLNIHDAFRQVSVAAKPTDTPIVAFRRNNGPWLACLELTELLALLRLREGSRPTTTEDPL